MKQLLNSVLAGYEKLLRPRFEESLRPRFEESLIPHILLDLIQ